MAQTIAVIDIGKTNKKILVFNENLKCIHSVKAKFEEYEKDGLIVEDMKGMVAWLWESFRAITSEYKIDCVSITTHGAFPVCIDDAGEIAVPSIAYTHEPGEEFHKEFFRKFGLYRPYDYTGFRILEAFENLCIKDRKAAESMRVIDWINYFKTNFMTPCPDRVTIKRKLEQYGVKHSQIPGPPIKEEGGGEADGQFGIVSQGDDLE